MTWFAFSLGLLGLLVALLALRKLARTRAEVSDLYALIYSVKNNLTEDLDGVKNGVAGMARREIERFHGKLSFTQDMLIVDAIALHPEAKSVMASYKMGSCSGCSVSTTETVGEGARGYGIDVDALLASLNALLAPGARKAAAPTNGSGAAPVPASPAPAVAQGEKAISSSSIPFLSS